MQSLIRLFSISVCLLLMISVSACTQDAPASQQEVTESSEARIAVDVGVIVSDMEESLSFYRDLLGLPVIADIRTSLIGAGRMIQLQHGASLIKLVQMDDSPDSQTESGITTTIGYRYITLMITDIDSIMGKIEAGEVPVTLPLTELGNGAKILMVEDPAGNIVEFVQEPN